MLVVFSGKSRMLAKQMMIKSVYGDPLKSEKREAFKNQECWFLVHWFEKIVGTFWLTMYRITSA
jgi:hypothetical protein